MNELSDAVVWLERTVRDHLYHRDLRTLRCRQEVLGVSVVSEVFFHDDVYGGVLALSVVSAAGIWKAEETFIVAYPWNMENWAEAVASAFREAMPTMLRSDAFCVERDRLALLELTAEGAAASGSKRL